MSRSDAGRILFPAPACLERDGKHDFRQKRTPLAVHGDGVAISQVARTGSKKVDCISWQSLLCKKQKALSSVLIFFAFGQQIKGEGYFRTWWSVWRHICWSLRALYSGKWPSTDKDGLAWRVLQESWQAMTWQEGCIASLWQQGETSSG